MNAAENTFESRLTIVGHAQRGDSPTAFDRLLGSRLGAAALEALAGSETGVMVGLSGRRVGRFPLEEVAAGVRPIDEDTYDLALSLAGLHHHGESKGKRS